MSSPRPTRSTRSTPCSRKLGRKLGIVHTYLKWQAPFPTVSDRAFLSDGLTLLISWAGTDTKQIISGTDDAWIRTRALSRSRR